MIKSHKFVYNFLRKKLKSNKKTIPIKKNAKAIKDSDPIKPIPYKKPS